jgi:hypothetical protein
MLNHFESCGLTYQINQSDTLTDSWSGSILTFVDSVTAELIWINELFLLAE